MVEGIVETEEMDDLHCWASPHSSRDQTFRRRPIYNVAVILPLGLIGGLRTGN